MKKYVRASSNGQLVYHNLGDVNFADDGRLVAEDPDRPGCYYVILCRPLYDTTDPMWIICEDYIDTSDDWFDIDEIANWAGDYIREDPMQLAVGVVDYYGPQTIESWVKYSSEEAESYLNDLNVADRVYWDVNF